jgi:hypothetical protein
MRRGLSPSDRKGGVNMTTNQILLLMNFRVSYLDNPITLESIQEKWHNEDKDKNFDVLKQIDGASLLFDFN